MTMFLSGVLVFLALAACVTRREIIYVAVTDPASLPTQADIIEISIPGLRTPLYSGGGPGSAGSSAQSAPAMVLPATADPLAATPPPAEVTPPAAPPTDTALVATNAPVLTDSTPLPPNFPTPVVAQIQVAEQLFERGRMFWLQPTGQIWVLVVTGEGRGTWTVYPDTYNDANPTPVPTITPAAGLLVPERGFGRLWLEVPEVREQLGYAVTPEFGYVSEYAYYAGGSVDAAGNYVAGPGYHLLYSLYDEQFRFDEADGTWRLGGG